MGRKLEKFKRASAGALAAAVIAMGTSCGYVEPVESTPIETTSEKPNYPQAIDVKPVYNENVLSNKEIKLSTDFNELIKTMINEDKYYGSNFDYLIERLTITGVNIEKVEDDVRKDFSVYADNSQPQVKITVCYIADVVNKENEEKSTVENSISYIVNSSDLTSVAEQGTSNVEYSELTDKLIETTVEKLEAVASGASTEQDEVSGRQSALTSYYLKNIISQLIDEIYEKEPYKSYLEQGYTLVSTSKELIGNSATNYVTYNEAYYGSNGNQLRCIFNTPNGYIEFAYTILNSINFEGIVIGCGFMLYTLAINEETDDIRLLANDMKITKTIDEETFYIVFEDAKSKSIVDIDRLREETPKHSSVFYGDGLYDIYTTICGENGFTDNMTNIVIDALNNNPTYEDGSWFWREGFTYDKSVEDINTFNEKMIISSLADENNTDVFIKEPTQDLEK